MINFTVGPVQMERDVRRIGKNQIPYFRTPEFSEVMKDNERLLCNFFAAPEESRCIFLTGSGTAAMEACVMNFFSNEDTVLVVNGGSFGQRICELCQIHGIPFDEIPLDFGTPLTQEALSIYDGKEYTGMFLQLCETSTGILYDMQLVGDFCKKNNIFLIVDAISGFLADTFSMKAMHVNVAITGSQKALALPPSMSFIVLDKTAQERCKKNSVQSLYFNLSDYLKNVERGQTPFTPAVSTLLQLNKRLHKIAKTGGVTAENKRISNRAAYFRSKIAVLPFKLFTPLEASSNCVTALTPTNQNVSAYSIFEKLKNKYGIWLCPNGGELKDSVIRVGHIGCIKNSEINRLIRALKKMNRNGEI